MNPAPLWQPCLLCLQFKVLKDFERMPSGKPRKKCRQCRYDAKNLKAREHRQAHPEESRKEGRENYLKYRETILANHKEKYWENPEEARQKGKEDYAKHRDTRLATEAQKRKDEPERFKKNRRQTYQNHREKRIRESKEYRETHLEEVREKQRTFYAENRERLLEDKRAWLAEHRDEVNERRNRKNRLNPEPNRARANKWYHEHPDQGKANANKADVKRRGLLAGRPSDKIDLRTLAERDHWTCHICHKRVMEKNWSRDHLIPVMYGGTHTWDNVSLAHRVCNSIRNKGYLPAQLRLFGLPPQRLNGTAS